MSAVNISDDNSVDINALRNQRNITTCSNVTSNVGEARQVDVASSIWKVVTNQQLDFLSGATIEPSLTIKAN